MKLTIHPVRRMKKGKVWVWRDCEVSQAQEYEIRGKGKMMRRVSTQAEAERLVSLFGKPKPPVDRRSLVGKRWADVKDKL